MASKESMSNFAGLRNKILDQTGKDYWRSVEEFVDAPEFGDFVNKEFPNHADELKDPVSRRNFIKVMGASLALAGLSGCVIQPSEKAVPYVQQPEGYTPGKSLLFATAITLGGVANGLLAKSNDFRPTKIDGNPDHPGSLGATDVLTQAALLELYDPDRSQEISYRSEPKTYGDLIKQIRSTLDENRKDGGAGVRFLTETISSPTLIAQFKQILSELPNAKWYQYEPINRDNATAGAKLAFGTAVNTIYNFEKADRILSLDADIFSGFNVRQIKDFAKKRSEEKAMSRLYVVESTMSLTGAKADHRKAVKPSQVAEIAKAVAKAVGVSGATSTYTDKWVDVMAKDLLAFKGKSLVIAGDNQSPAVHALAHAINATLGNVGTTVSYTETANPESDKLQIDGLKELIKDIDAKAVKVLAILGGNPVYNTPSDLKLSLERMSNIPMRLHLSSHFNETGEQCHWHISEKHFLESWSDTRAFDGTVTVTQPLIKPLYDGKNIHEIVQLFAKENFDRPDLDIVKAYWQKTGIGTAKAATATANSNSNSAPVAAAPAKGFEDAWKKAIHDGVLPNTTFAAKTVTLNTAFLSQPEVKPTVSGKFEISILPDPSVYDGRFTNNGWLQELPNPINKITWENVALISPKTAKELGINTGGDEGEYAGGTQGTSFINTKGGNLFSDLVKLKFQGAEISQNVPMWVQPGQPDDVITIYLGYGRTRAGKVGTGIGYNAYDVQKSDALHFGSGEITKVGEKTTIASTQTHFNMEGRDILRVWDIEEFVKHPDMGHQHDEYDASMYPRFSYDGHKWGMTIDLNSCVGCNACVIACQAENNIPVIGKDQVERSREMHWMRIDAYYGGEDINNPAGPYFQPMLCQQCEQAPCEVVCPVHATVHSAEGLNDMVYNRCVGTRYCSNNCPYKVRRFNFLLYQDWNTPQYKLMRNPEVTVRSRGVMEKCTYCTQRISAARIVSERDGTPIKDGSIVTACQEVCPTNAIVFGDLNDKTSKVAKLRNDHRNYNVLNELNTQPRTTYLASLKNQNKEMPDYRAPKAKESKSH
jgi:MoCo/4Fe-4S cofactor protein with predicted Tat translocation signal